MGNLRKIGFLLVGIVFIFSIIISSTTYAAASASIDTSVTTMQVGEKATITVSVSGTESWSLSVSASGGTLSGDTKNADARGKEVSEKILTPTFTADSPGTYTITLTGTIASTDDVNNNNKQTISKSVTVKVIEKIENNTGGNNTTGGNTSGGNNTSTTPTKSSDATIKSITAQAGGKSLSVSQSSTKFSTTIEADISEVRFTVTTNSNKASIDSNRSTSGIGFIKNSESSGKKTYTMSSLKEGNNVIKITIIAEDGTTKNYTFVVTRKVSQNKNEVNIPNIVDEDPEEEPKDSDTPDETDQQTTDELGLKSLVITGVEISPQFNINTYEYTATISGSDSVEIIALPTAEDATVEIVGNDNLILGENLITILVKKDEEVKTYQIILTKTEEKATETTSNSLIPQDFDLSWKHIAIIVVALIIAVIIIIKLVSMARKPIEEDEIVDEEMPEKSNKKGKRYK